jgi:formyl-CoA transferase
MPSALEGLRVLEFASYVSGPYAGVLLADMGAEVIKVEAPGHGDPFRAWGEDAFSPTFESLNRNKKSVVLDLKTDSGRDHAVLLADTADVLIENFRPGTLDRLGLDYDTLSGRNPGLVYCSITGFGATGPYRDRPGYDTVGQAMGGLLSLLTEKDDPKPMGVSFSDHLSGLMASHGILAALVARGRSGAGQRVETSLLAATAAFLGENAARYFHTGGVPDRATRTHTAQVYAFTDRDGLPFVVHLSSPVKFWQGLVRVVGRETWLDDPDFSERPARIRNYDRLHAALAEIFATDTRDKWLAALEEADVPAGPLYDLAEVFEDAQVRHLGMRVSVPHPTRGTIDLVANGVRLSATPSALKSAAPLLGQHTDELLADMDSANRET